MSGYRIPKKFTKLHDVFSKASVTDGTLSNNPAYYVPQVELIGRGELVYVYEVENCIITATNLGITVTRAAGLITIDVPQDVFLFSVRATGDSNDVGTDNNVRIKVVYDYASVNNYMLQGMEPTGLTVWDYSLINNTGQDQSETYFAMKIDKIWHCTLTTQGTYDITLEVKVEDMNYDNWKINIGF